MNYKEEICKIINVSKKIGFLPVPDSVLFNVLYLARYEEGPPLVSYVYELVELGFNLFNHNNDTNIRIMMKNIIAVCDKELDKIEKRL